MLDPFNNENMTKLIVKLNAAGESELAERLHKHLEARSSGANLETLREIWLR